MPGRKSSGARLTAVLGTKFTIEFSQSSEESQRDVSPVQPSNTSGAEFESDTGDEREYVLVQ
jgi:hypothetical protein